MAPTLRDFADKDRMEQDIDEEGTPTGNIASLITRSSEDASEEITTTFFELVDTDIANPGDNLPTWFLDLTTQLATSYFWVKSNGTDEAKNQREQVREMINQALIKRFSPVTVRS